jgi:hypothetical protein
MTADVQPKDPIQAPIQALMLAQESLIEAMARADANATLNAVADLRGALRSLERADEASLQSLHSRHRQLKTIAAARGHQTRQALDALGLLATVYGRNGQLDQPSKR